MSGFHTHAIAGLVMLRATNAICTGDDLEAFVPNAALADRIAELLNRHGLADVPDDVSDLEPAATRRESHEDEHALAIWCATHEDHQ